METRASKYYEFISAVKYAADVCAKNDSCEDYPWSSHEDICKLICRVFESYEKNKVDERIDEITEVIANELTSQK